VREQRVVLEHVAGAAFARGHGDARAASNSTRPSTRT
jgi:hypothetical protein